MSVLMHKKAELSCSAETDLTAPLTLPLILSTPASSLTIVMSILIQLSSEHYEHTTTVPTHVSTSAAEKALVGT